MKNLIQKYGNIIFEISENSKEVPCNSLEKIIKTVSNGHCCIPDYIVGVERKVISVQVKLSIDEKNYMIEVKSSKKGTTVFHLSSFMLHKNENHPIPMCRDHDIPLNELHLYGF
jgi:hypothetical protein